MNTLDILYCISTIPDGRDGPMSILSFEFYREFFNAPGNDKWTELRGYEEFDSWCVWCAASV